MAEKRISIRKKIRRIVLLISIASLVLTASVGFFSMMKIRSASKEAFTTLARQNVGQQVRSRADVAHSRLSGYTDYVQFLAGYIHSLYNDAPLYERMGSEVQPPLTETGAGEYSFQRMLATPAVALSDVKTEMALLSHLREFFMPFINQNGSVVVCCYAATRTGVLLSYDAWAAARTAESGESYYNYFDSAWYTKAKTAQHVFFTSPYDDSFGRGVCITCACPFFDADDRFAGVVCMDMLISDLYDGLVSFDVGDGSCVFLFDADGAVITSEKSGELPSQIPVQRLLHADDGTLVEAGDAFYSCAHILATGWRLCVYVPKALIFAPARAVNYVILISAIIFVLVFLFVVLAVCVVAGIFSVMLTNPVSHLRRDVDMISSGVITHRADIVGNDEISDLSAGINLMADALQTYTDIVTEKERLDTELEVAMRIQANMLPVVEKTFPHGHRDFELAASMMPAKEIGGDFYDFFLIDSDHLALVMADVAGKGVPAALLMVTAKTLIKSQMLASQGSAVLFEEGDLLEETPSFSTAAICARVNQLLCMDNSPELFVTAWIGILELSTGRLTGTNAGHENPAFKRAGLRYELIKTEHNPPLGSLPDITYSERTLTLSGGDRLFLYTDGLVESKNEATDEFGTARLLELLNQNLLLRPDMLLKTVKAAVQDFSNDITQYDDITMLSLYYAHE